MKSKVRKYKAFNITQEELSAIMNGAEQMRSDAESSDEEYAKWAEKQITLINQFRSKLKIQ